MNTPPHATPALNPGLAARSLVHRCCVWLVGAAACANAWAQALPPSNTPPSTLNSQRERTRQAVEAVQADQRGEWDDARGLGAALDQGSARQRAQMWQERAQSSAAVDAAGLETTAPPNSTNYLQEIQWPTPLSSGKRRVLARPPSNPDGFERLAFTPDFSRQSLTLAALAQRAVIDLPQQELADLVSAPTFAAKAVPDDSGLSLHDLVHVGLSFSPVMDQVMAQLDAATNQSKEARADLLPRASVRLAQGPEQSKTVSSSSETNTSQTTSSQNLRLTQPLFNVPSLQAWASLRNTQVAASWRVQAAREAVALAVTQATLNLVSARMVLEQSQVQLTQFERLLAYVTTRASTGAASTVDLERTRTRVLQARQVRLEQLAAFKSAQLELQRLTGQNPVALRLPYLNQLPALPATHTEIRRLAWSQSHELRALRAEVSAQQHTLTSNQALLLPQVGLSLERDQTKNVRGDNGPLTDNRLLVTATWQASLAGKEGYQVAAAAAELGNRQAKLTEQGERLMQQVDADFALLQSTSLRVAAGQAEELASAAVVKAVDEQLQTGRMGTLLEVLDAYERHFAARQRLIQTLSQQMQSQAQLLARMGLLSTVEDATLVELAAASASTPPTLPALPNTPQPASTSTPPPAPLLLKTQPIPAATELVPTELAPMGNPAAPNTLNP